MIIAVISCWKYRDAWKPFFALLEKFWPDHPETLLLTDYYDSLPELPASIRVFSGSPSPLWTWCQTLQYFAQVVVAKRHDGPLLVMQEDFFLTAPVNTYIVERGLTEMKRHNASSVRLYPVPGADLDYGDPYFGKCSQTAPYRISCQATIWRPSFLARIATVAGDSAMHFEVVGNRYAEELDDTVLAFKREALPPNEWPLQYLCSGISAGRWNPDSKRLFESHGIEADYSLRAMA